MSDWAFLNKHRVRGPTPSIPEIYFSDDSYGFNGLFRLPNEGNIIRCIASDGMDADGPEWKWQHVSVSVEIDKRPPRWGLMCWVKDLSPQRGGLLSISTETETCCHFHSG